MGAAAREIHDPGLSWADRVRACAKVSLLRYSPALVILAVAIADCYRLADPDLWGHILSGQMILSTGHIARTDPFNYSAPNHVWLHHEWLSEVLVALTWDHLGIIGLKILKFGCACGVIGFVVMAAADAGASLIAQLVVALAAALSLTLEMQYRPQMFAFAFFAVLVWTLARDCYGRHKGLWMVIPLLAVWSNFHGSFVMGLAALFVYAGTCAIQDLAAGRRMARALWLTAIALTSAAATLINPIGFESWRTIVYSLRDPLTARVMADWRPLWSRLATESPIDVIGAYFWFAAALMVGFVILYAASRSFEDLPMAAVAIVASYAAFAATRNISFAAIAIAPPLALRIGAARATGSQSGKIPRRGFMNEAIVYALAAGLAFITGLFSPRMADSLPSPAGAIHFMDANGLHGNILNEFSWGHYLCWQGTPRDKVFIDGRFDLVYPLAVIRDYTWFRFGNPQAARVLGAYPHDYVMIRPEGGAYRVMKARADWRLIYEDPHVALFAPPDVARRINHGRAEHGSASIDYFPN